MRFVHIQLICAKFFSICRPRSWLFRGETALHAGHHDRQPMCNRGHSRLLRYIRLHFPSSRSTSAQSRRSCPWARLLQQGRFSLYINLVPPNLRHALAGGKRVHLPGRSPSPLCVPISSLSSNMSCSPTQIPRNGLPDRMPCSMHSTQPPLRKLRMASPNAASPGDC